MTFDDPRDEQPRRPEPAEGAPHEPQRGGPTEELPVARPEDQWSAPGGPQRPADPQRPSTSSTTAPLPAAGPGPQPPAGPDLAGPIAPAPRGWDGAGPQAARSPRPQGAPERPETVAPAGPAPAPGTMPGQGQAPSGPAGSWDQSQAPRPTCPPQHHSGQNPGSQAPGPQYAQAQGAPYGPDPSAHQPYPGQTFGGGSSAVSGPAPAKERRRGGCGLLAGATALALLAGLLGGAGGAYAYDRWLREDKPTTSVESKSGETVQRPDGSIQSTVAKALPAVVTIRGKDRSEQWSGSGFVYTQDGYIITNAHVAAPRGEGGELEVELEDGTVLPATVRGSDQAYDIAVIKVDKKDLPVLELADSDKVAIGDPVIAIGSPFRLTETVTTGIISAKDRPVASGDGSASSPDAYISAIQTDAAINPGNSGGPLLDTSGRVVGVNSAGRSAPGASSGFSIGLGFAIPANQVKKTAQELIENGKATHPIIGALFDSRYDAGDGAQILDDDGAIVKDGPAEKAGLKPGDRIVSFDGKKVTALLELVVGIRSHDVGDKVPLQYVRDGKTVDAEVTLAGKTE